MILFCFSGLPLSNRFIILVFQYIAHPYVIDLAGMYFAVFHSEESSPNNLVFRKLAQNFSLWKKIAA